MPQSVQHPLLRMLLAICACVALAAAVVPARGLASTTHRKAIVAVAHFARRPPPPPPPSSPPTSPPSDPTPPYLSLNFDGAPMTSQWIETPAGEPGLFPTVPGFSGNGVGLVSGGASYGPNPSSEMTAIDTPAYNAYAGMSPQGAIVDGQDTWYHVRMMLPSPGYAPTTGHWNWLVEWHTDDHTSLAPGPGAVSMAMGIYTDYPVVTGGVGANPHLVLRLAGGSTAAPTFQSIELPALVMFDHWYDISFHVVWSTSASVGLAEWFVDGQEVLSQHFPTLYSNPDGTRSYNGFGVYNYHLSSPWDSTVEFDDIAIGPSRSSVGG